MSLDRITKLRIQGLRAIESVELDLAGLVTLIGDNGSGKSCIVEAAEILRQASKPLSHVSDIIEKRHGGLRTLLRRGAKELALGVTVDGGGPRIDYDFAIANVGTFSQVVRETVSLFVVSDAPSPLRVLIREGGQIRVTEGGGEIVPIGEQALALPWLGVKAQPAIRRLVDALSRIDVHVPFETRAVWPQAELSVTQGPRWPSVLESAGKLERYGLNLPSAFQTLRNRGGDPWLRVLERAKLGLGEDRRDFSLSPFGRGQIGLEVLFGAFPDAPIPAEALSDGQLSYLCFIALLEFHEHSSLLVFDEPEVHLHPHLLARVALMLEDASAVAPIVVATHSDHFLDALSNPEQSVRLCSLDERRSLVLRQPDATKLSEWLEDYRGLGAIRTAGYEQHVFPALDNRGTS